MTDTSRLAEKAQGLHIEDSPSTDGVPANSAPKPSIRSAATAAAAAYAWRKASKSKSGTASRANLSVVPMRPSMEGLVSTTSSTGVSPVLGRRSSTPASSLTSQVSLDNSVPNLAASASSEVVSDSRSVLNEARAKLATVEKRTVDQWRLATAEAKAISKIEKGEEKARQLEQQITKLEDELRDAAAVEVALYSVVAEHGSSAHKVHTPARRLARFYKHAFENSSQERRASSAKNIVSGLVLVCRACGNDVPRFVSNSSHFSLLQHKGSNQFVCIHIMAR